METKENPEAPQKFIHPVQFYKEDFFYLSECFQQMGVSKIEFNAHFTTPILLEQFVKNCNREFHEEKITTEFVATYLSIEKGKMMRVKKERNESFTEMATIQLSSTYQAHIFLKFYEKKVKQLEYEYRYQLILSDTGKINVYMEKDKKVSSMFINQITTMKRNLNCFEVKDLLKSQKIIFSDILAQKIQKQKIFKEVWYQKNQSPIVILYSEKQSLKEIKQIVGSVTDHHVVIIKMLDPKTNFKINCQLFHALVEVMKTEINQIKKNFEIDLEFNLEKLGFVIHNVHEVFAKQIKEALLDEVKKHILMTVRGRNVRKIFNLIKQKRLKTNFFSILYSKKVICICINKTKAPSDTLAKLMTEVAQNISHETQVSFHWVHLKEEEHESERKLVQKGFLKILSDSKFAIENFQGFFEGRDMKVSLRVKECSFEQEEQWVSYVSSLFKNLILLKQEEVQYPKSAFQESQIARLRNVDDSDDRNFSSEDSQSEDSIHTAKTEFDGFDEGLIEEFD